MPWTHLCSNLSFLQYNYWSLASALTLHVCYQSSTYSNISCRSSPRIRTCSLLPPPDRKGCPAPQQELAQLHRVNRSSLGLSTRATSTRCSNLQLHHGDLLPHTVVRHMIVTRSCAQLERMHAAWPDADRRDAPLRRTHCSTIYFGRFLGGWQTGTLRWSGKNFHGSSRYSPRIVHHSSRDDWPRTRIMDGKDPSAISPGG